MTDTRAERDESVVLEVISWLVSFRAKVSQNLKIDYDPTLPIAEEKQKEKQTKTYVQ